MTSLKLNLKRLWMLPLLVSLLLGACTPRTAAGEAQQAFRPLDELRIADTVTLVGVGEATHGNAEFVSLRREVLELLVTRHGFRAFAIEGDFGGGQVVNRYVLEGVGTAEDAARAIGFAIYRTQEMADLIEWIRQYNLAAAPEERIHVYGFDMQRYDHNINGLTAYLEQVDPGAAAGCRQALADLNDETVFDQQVDKVRAGLRAVQKIRADLQANQAAYIAASSAEAFDLADQFAASIEENATLRSGTGNYSQLRDTYMAEKVGWILEFEQRAGRGKVMIAGHNGHIEKSAAAAQYRSMGSRLSETYGAQYYAVGADFLESTFNSADAAGGERKEFSVKNRSALNRAFEAAGMETACLEMSSALESEALRPLVTRKQAVSAIGDSFSTWNAYLPLFYALQMVPAEAFDAMIFVRSAHPTTMLPQ